MRHGGDGEMWLSKQLRDGSFRWVKPPRAITKSLQRAARSDRWKVANQSKRRQPTKPRGAPTRAKGMAATKKRATRVNNKYGVRKSNYEDDHKACKNKDERAELECVNKLRFERCANTKCKQGDKDVPACFTTAKAALLRAGLHGVEIGRAIACLSEYREPIITEDRGYGWRYK